MVVQANQNGTRDNALTEEEAFWLTAFAVALFCVILIAGASIIVHRACLRRFDATPFTLGSFAVLLFAIGSAFFGWTMGDEYQTFKLILLGMAGFCLLAVYINMIVKTSILWASIALVLMLIVTSTVFLIVAVKLSSWGARSKKGSKRGLLSKAKDMV